jgi:hypothetical protein
MEPENEVKVTIFVAILSALIATPIAVFCDWLISNILAAPTAVGVVADQADVALASILPDSPHKHLASPIDFSFASNNPTRHQSISTKLRKRGTLPSSTHQSLKLQYRAQAEAEMNELVKDIIEYRKTLTLKERKDFDGKLDHYS